MSKVINSFRVKGVKYQTMNVNHWGFDWIIATRGWLYITDDSLVFKDWKKYYTDIDEAVLVSTPYLWTKAYILIVPVKDGFYHFGLNPNKFWQKGLPFNVRKEIAGIKGTMVNIVRVLLYSFIIYGIISSLAKGL